MPTSMDVGIDLVRVDRVEKLLNDPSQAELVFAPEEIADDLRTMAGRFAAKEAYFKAKKEKGNGRDVIVGKEPSGAPTLIVPERNVSLRISHDGEYAIAVVILY